MFVTFYYRFVAVCLVWSFIAGPLLALLRKRSLSYRQFEGKLGLSKVAAGLAALDRFGARLPLALVLAFLAGSVIAEIQAMRVVAEYFASDRAIERGWPISFMIREHYFAEYHTPLFGKVRIGLALLTALQALALRCLWTKFSQRTPKLRDLLQMAAAAVVMYGVSIFSRTMEQPDLYAYIIISKLNFLAYTPPPLNSFGGDFSLLDNVWKLAWGVQNYPYGPLWIGLSHAAFGWIPHLYPAMVTARCVETVAIALLGFAVYHLGFGARGAMLVAFNPAIIHEYVVEGHNDIWPMAFVALAFLAVRRYPVLAVAAVVCAGLIKLPYAVVGLLAFALVPQLANRIGLGAVSVITTAGLSFALGGMQYVESVRYHAGTETIAQPHSVIIVRTALIVVSLLAVAIAVLWRRTRPAAGYALPQLAMADFAWYVGLGMPYALLDEQALPIFLAAFPVTVFMNDFWLGAKYSFACGVVGAAAVAVSQFVDRGDQTRSEYAGTMSGEFAANSPRAKVDALKAD